MPRPPKDGIDYFSFDVGFLEDRKVKLIKAEFGAKGVVILLGLMCEIYRENGYFTLLDEEGRLLLSDTIGCDISPQLISEVVQGCLKRSFFDKGVFEVFGVLTSAGIQRRYIRASVKRDSIPMISEYWLLTLTDVKDVPASSRDKLAFKSISGTENPVNSTGNPENSTDKTQRKVKESKVYTTPSPGPTEQPSPPDGQPGEDPPAGDDTHKFSDDSEEMQLSRFMAKCMRKNNPKCKIPQNSSAAQSWCRHFDYLMRLDGHSYEEIVTIIKFSQADEFWSTNILSPRNLRKKWDRLYLKWKREEEKYAGSDG